MPYEHRAFTIGAWKNIEELERSLTVDELSEIVSTMIDMKQEDRQFDAALQGVDLEEAKDNNRSSGRSSGGLAARLRGEDPKTATQKLQGIEIREV